MKAVLLTLLIPLACALVLPDGKDKQSITCYMCQMGLQTIASKLEDNPAAMQGLADQLSTSCDNIPSESQQLACLELYTPEVFPQLVKNFASSDAMAPVNLCKNMRLC